jgi:UDP-glucose 4-epimerase
VSRVLVLGGAGYIGSHMVKHLACAGHEVLVVDSLAQGHRDAVRYGEFIQGDIGDASLLDRIFAGRAVDAVMHFAGLIQVGESVERPAEYYANNVAKCQVLLDAMRRHGVGQIVFSSSAAVYGEPQSSPIDEDHPRNPINPYGRCKWIVERMLEDYGRAYGLRSISLRYFNAAGADPEGELGERHEPETHLIPLVLQAASGRRDSVTVNGCDYPTADGTCVRDYIHVSDLCEAHSLALSALLAGTPGGTYNLGTGTGYSVRQVIDAAIRVTGRRFKVADGPRRPGDPAVLVASCDRIRRELGWVPRHGELDTIIAHAWAWERRNTG